MKPKLYHLVFFSRHWSPSTRAPVGACLDPKRSVMKISKTEGKINVAMRIAVMGKSMAIKGLPIPRACIPHVLHSPTVVTSRTLKVTTQRDTEALWSSYPLLAEGWQRQENHQPSYRWTHSSKHKDFFSPMMLREPWDYLRLLKCPKLMFWPLLLCFNSVLDFRNVDHLYFPDKKYIIQTDHKLSVWQRMAMNCSCSSATSWAPEPQAWVTTWCWDVGSMHLYDRQAFYKLSYIPHPSLPS